MDAIMQSARTAAGCGALSSWGVSPLCSRSGKGFVFTLEAAVALVVFFSLIATLSSLSFGDYSDVLLYKQAGDVAEIAMKMHCEHNATCVEGLAAMLGRKTSGSKCTTVTRTAVTSGLEYEKVRFRLCV